MRAGSGMPRDRTCSSSPLFCSARFAKQASLLICLLVAFPGLDNGTEAFSAVAPAVFRGRGTFLSKGPGHVNKLANTAFTLGSRAHRLQPAALSLRMQGDSWLDRAIDKLIGDDAYGTTLTGETTDGNSGYYVIIQDDDEHTVDEVVKIVRKVTSTHLIACIECLFTPDAFSKWRPPPSEPALVCCGRLLDVHGSFP